MPAVARPGGSTPTSAPRSSSATKRSASGARTTARACHVLTFFSGRPNAEQARKALGLPGGSLKGAAQEVLAMIPEALRAYAAIGRSLALARIEEEHEAKAAERAAGRRARAHPHTR